MPEDEQQDRADEEQQNEAASDESPPEEDAQEASESAEESAEEQPDAPSEGETAEEPAEEPAAEGEAEPEVEPEESAEEAPQPEESEAGEAAETQEQPPQEEAAAEESALGDEAAEEPAEEGEAEDTGEQPAEEEEEAPEEPAVEDEALEAPAAPPPQGSNTGIIVGIIVLAIAIAGILFALLRKGPSEPTKVESAGAETKAPPAPPKPLTPEEIAEQKAVEAKRKAQERVDTIKALVAKLDTDDFVTSSEVKGEILKYRKEAIPALATALNADSYNLRENAIKTLAAMDLPESLRPLSLILAKDKSADVRTAAAQALGTTGNLAAVDPLIKAVADSSTDVQDAAIEGLEAITRNYKLMETDEEDGKALQKIWADWWVKNKAKLAAELAPKEKKDEPVHLHAFRTTAHMHAMAYLHPLSEKVPGGALHGEEGSHKLLRYLATLKAADLMAAIEGDVEWLLKTVGVDDPAKLCLKIVNPQDDLTHYVRGRLPGVHVSEVAKGGPKPSKEVQAYLLKRLKEELPTDPMLRANAARQLGEMKAKEALPLLAKCVKEDPHASVKLLAARAICKIGDAKAFQETALPYLAGIIKDGRARPEIKASAALALGESGQKQAVEPLLTAVGSTVVDLRRRAHDGLVAVTGKDSIKWDKTVTPQKLKEQWQACLK